jgi:isochorismate synthase
MAKTILNQNSTFALYRLPHSEEIFLIHASQFEPLKKIPIHDVEHHQGFVISEFLSDGFCYVIEGNKTSIKALSEITLKTDLQEIVFGSKNEKPLYLERANHFVNAFNTRFKKAILSRIKPADVPVDFSPIKAFSSLCKRLPDAFIYLHYTPQFGMWMGATPEPLLVQTDDGFFTVSLAGTKKHSDKIVWGIKELEEQDFVTEYIEQLLSDATIGYERQKTQTIKAGKMAHLKTIFHLKPPFKIGELLNKLHPTPAVCGLPKDQAMSLIADVEGYNRQLYTGFVGPNTDQLKIFVNLRCMQLFKNKALVYVGGGITQHSDPEQEWLETELKASTMLEVLGIGSDEGIE